MNYLASKITLLALLFSSIASAQSSCNPLSATSCSPDKALGTSISDSFDEESQYFHNITHVGSITYSDSGVAMTLAEQGDNPTIQSDFYIMYGKVEVVLKAANGTGIVSSFYLQSDDLDEIDIEWFGGDTTQFQSNYFSKGNTTTHDRGEYHGVSTPQDTFHNYTIDWAMDKTTWYLDGSSVRVLENSTSEGYPQSPMFIKFGIWAGGDPELDEEGTIEWAGGETDYSQGPFTMYIEKVIVTDYSTGSQYSYSDQSGSWESIEATDGEVYGRYEKAQVEFAELTNGESLSSDDDTTSVSSATSSTLSRSTASSSVESSSSSTTTISSTLKSSTSKKSAATTSSRTGTSSSVKKTSTTTPSTKSETYKSTSSATSNEVTSTVTESSSSATKSASSTSSSLTSTASVQEGSGSGNHSKLNFLEAITAYIIITFSIIY
ncbi:hypothetical protein KAFR_0K01270 [Kazachstania africana CBS 2517]|uniref:Crh-like protein n=1 Tax=Kazachstania africana (strain ATCC 22294 / BCRC 22015 / CBS 2517 / CECT 1963 / NBRC 1671 / NRRL Y-8276) TaxID=1071382 RepID=H2B1I1_KAZAF|nr:hypothetical protein KAFR_0K01270 [Kazachstania africana CBS 2517]CCF60481.1 hypothetical protein KAFR_0K01270 [Kazachstania africana CBS 2517]